MILSKFRTAALRSMTTARMFSSRYKRTLEKHPILVQAVQVNQISIRFSFFLTKKYSFKNAKTFSFNFVAKISFQAGILMGAGDFIAQIVIEQQKLQQWDAMRTLKFFSIGFVIAVSSYPENLFTENVFDNGMTFFSFFLCNTGTGPT